MGEHDTWFDFLPGYANLQAFLSHYLSRHWQWLVFQDTKFTLAHVAGALLVAIFVLVGALRWRRHTAQGNLVPPAQFGYHNLIEMFTDAVFNTMAGIMGEKKAERYLPLVGTLGFFIFFSNVLALVPGFVPPTDTLKTNVALAAVVFLMTHVYGLREHGLPYLKHFLGPYLPIAFLMLPIELVSHIARPISLSLRLMGNMVSDHRVAMVFFGLVPFLVPVPFLVLGVLVSIVQAFVFCALTMVYIALAVEHEEHH